MVSFEKIRTSFVALVRDFKNTLRIWRLNPGSTFAAFAALAASIGATTAIFSVLSSLLISPLPIADSDHVVRVTALNAKNLPARLSLPDALDLKKRTRTSDVFAFYRDLNGNLGSGTRPAMVHILETDASLFAVLGVRMARGRPFPPAANQPGADCEAVISWNLWTTQLGGAVTPGSMIRLNEKPCLLDGVLPKDLDLPIDADVWLPTSFVPNTPGNLRGSRAYWGIAHLKAGATTAQFNSELAAVAKALRNENPVLDASLRLNAVPLRDYLSQSVKQSILILFAAVAGVLLIACANVANLLLARAAARTREISVRIAVGASNGALLQQLLTESMLLAFASSLAGVLLSFLAVRWIKSLPTVVIPRPDAVVVDWRVMLFAVLAAALTGLLFGTLPALKLAFTSLTSILSQAGGRTSETREQQFTRKLLLAVESAIATVLLIGSLLLLRSFSEVSKINPGFQTDHLMTAYVSLNPARYGKDTNDLARLARQVLDRLKTKPGVIAATFTTSVPLQGTSGSGSVQIEGQPVPLPSMNLPQVLNTGVSPSFRATFNIPLKAGVDLTEQDDRDDATAVLVNSAFVKTFFPNESAIGKRIRYAPDLNPQAQWEQIVGVIGDTRQSSFDEASDPELYRPLARNISLRPAIVMRTVDNPLLHQRDIESALHDVDSELPIFSPRTMEQIEARRLGLRSFITTLLTGFALIAVLLSCGGIFAVIAYSISQRTSEIGVRMAFGATAGDISRMIALQALIPAFSGIGAGLALAFLLNRYLSKLPFAVENASFPAYSGAVVLLALCSTVAALLPARRAALTDPWTALHYE